MVVYLNVLDSSKIVVIYINDEFQSNCFLVGFEVVMYWCGVLCVVFGLLQFQY